MAKRQTKPKKKKQARLCKVWPRCACIARGYYNVTEGGEWATPCGVKPR